MDLEHLKKLVDAAIEEGERLNADGPVYAELVDYVLDSLRSEFVSRQRAERGDRRG